MKKAPARYLKVVKKDLGDRSAERSLGSKLIIIK